MHEGLITKHDVEKIQEWAYLINNPCNCVLVHHNCHMRILGHGGIGSFTKCAIQLVRYEGLENVEDFILDMGSYYPKASREAYRKFLGIDWNNILR